MKYSSFLKLNIALAISLLTAPAFAEDKTDSTPATDESGEAGPPKASKSPRPPAAWCGLYSKLVYLTGEFSGSDRTDNFVRDGLKLGASCNYNNNSRLTLGLGAEFYIGKFQLNHAEDLIQASISYLEKGWKEFASLTFDLHPIKIVALMGVENTYSSRFKLGSLQVDLGNGDWLNLKKFASEHLTSNGELEIWEAGLNVEFPFRKRSSFTFGGLWQRYGVVVHVNLDAEGKRVLEALNYDSGKVDRDFERSRNFFYLTPGLKWCGKKFCTSLVVPWGVFQPDKWSWGVVMGTEMKF